MDVNAKGAFLGLRHAAPAMQRTGGGAVVNIGSIAAFNGQAGLHPAYGASKAAVVGLTRSAALRYAAAGIRVNAVHPGFMPPMRTARSVDPAWRARMVGQVPMGREGRVDEVAAAVLFLASDDSSYITGADLAVDGGMLIA
jgi:NAD(P)-dependent dehydrogenase (short-subunit alcohol dehydrogenase family)